MTAHNPEGDAFLNYLLDGDFFEGKGVWVNTSEATREIYRQVIAANPELASEDPYGDWFNRDRVRRPGENEVVLSRLEDAPQEQRREVQSHRQQVRSGRKRMRAVFAGGPAAKIAAVLLAMQPEARETTDVVFLYDGGEQSNESASASYEHVNHANALNAEHDNSGLAILWLSLKRALLGESDPRAALDADYHKVDLWPAGFALRDVPIYLRNEVHGRLQALKSFAGIMNDHDKSRLASLRSTRILSWIEDELDVALRLPRDEPRSFFLYLSRVEHRNSYREHRILRRFVGLDVEKVSEAVLRRQYGDISNIISGDLIRENNCIRHGFDRVCSSIVERIGGSVLDRLLIERIYFDGGSPGTPCAAVQVRDQRSGACRLVPVDYLGLSLGPTATYRFSVGGAGRWRRLCDRLGLLRPVPHQTVATGFSGQLLFRIRDKDRFRRMPQTGLKQTHFVEVGRAGDFLILKLTSGGNIGVPVYSRSYALGALANMFRVLTEGCGLDFLDVVCAWPGIRGVNAANNGQVVRLAENCALRFGEGGTGMSKMGANAQTLLDMTGLPHGLPENLVLPRSLYAHTVVDRRRLLRWHMS
ncbi:MAG: hypothetical protein Tsb0019_10530 [Roseibium sp.]